MVTIFTPFYRDKNNIRHQENLACLVHNLNNPEIDYVVVVVDDSSYSINEITDYGNKLRRISYGKRPTYSDMFEIANAFNATNSDGGDYYSVICNTDIYFEQEAIKLIKASIDYDTCYALSRWDVGSFGELKHYNTRDSQDSWVFKDYIRGVNGDFYMGKAGCDNRIAYELVSAGYRVLNPSKSIKSCHLHLSNVRNYTREDSEIVPKPYHFVYPTFINEVGYIPTMGKQNTEKPEMTQEQLKKAYSYDMQKEQMSRMAAVIHRRKPKYKLAILIPTMYNRISSFNSLVRELNKQIMNGGHRNKCIIYFEQDGGVIPIGAKRNELIMKADTEYLAFFDDDDVPSDDYIDSLITAIENSNNADAVTFNCDVFFDKKFTMKIVYDNSCKDGQIHETIDDVRVLRKSVGHLCAIKKSILLQCPFLVIWGDGGNRKERKDNGSDVNHLLDLSKSNLIKSAVHINKSLYYYYYNTKK